MRFAWLLLCLGLVPATSSGEPAVAAVDARTPAELIDGGHVRLRIAPEPAREVVLGQQTKIIVEILTDTWFTKAPLYPELSLPGAVALMPEQLGTNFSERIEGVTFAAQRRSYVVYPQRAGRLAVPPIPIRLGVAVDAKPSELFTLTTPPLTLQVVLPPEVEAVDRFVTTPKLEVAETWDRSLEELRVGDALKRTVRLEADDALGMLLPPLTFEAPSGIALYHDQPRAEDRVNRGQYQGERTEAVTYVLQRAGEFPLPELQIHWWNTSSGTLEVETLEAQTLTVAPSEVGEAEVLAPPAAGKDARALVEAALDWLRDHATVVAGALAFGWFLLTGLRRSAPGGLAAVERWARARRDSESAHFRTLTRAVRGGDDTAIVRSYWRWRQRAREEWPAARFEAAAGACGFREVWSRFEQARYASTSSDAVGVDRGTLSGGLTTLRRALRQSTLVPTGRERSLNPRGLPSA